MFARSWKNEYFSVLLSTFDIETAAPARSSKNVPFVVGVRFLVTIVGFTEARPISAEKNLGGSYSFETRPRREALFLGSG